MAKGKSEKAKEPFFKNPWNVMLTIATLVLLGVFFFNEDDRGHTTAEKVWQRISRGEAGDAIQETIERGFDTVVRSCEKPPTSVIEAHYKDNAGALPVDQGFDADPGEICGNGKTYYCTSKPPKKPIPASWTPPPKVGDDPDYEGPAFDAPFKESPYAMPSSKAILTRRPIKDMDDPTIRQEIKNAVEMARGKVGFIGKRDPKEHLIDLGARFVRLDETLFETDDDEPLAKRLLGQGVSFVIMDRTRPYVRPWIEERMTSVRLRLRDAVSLAWFHPVVFGSGWAMYRVAPPLDIPKHVKRRITTRIRAMLTDSKPEDLAVNLSTAPVGDKTFRAIVSLRWRAEKGLKGRKLVKKMSHGRTLVAAIDDAVKRIKNDWVNVRNRKMSDRTLGISFIPQSLPEAMKQMEIEVDVLHDICALTDRSPRNLLWYVELGLEGVSLRGDGSFQYLEPSYAVHMEMNSEVVYLERMLMKNKLH